MQCVYLPHIFLRPSLFLKSMQGKGSARRDAGVGTEINPLSEDYGAACGREPLVGKCVAVAENEIVYVGVCAQIFIGKDDEGFRAAPPISIRHRVTAAVVIAERTRKRHSPARVHRGEEPLAEAVVKQSAQESERARGTPHSIAMRDKESPAAYVADKSAVYDLYAEFRRQIIEYPDVVIAYHPCDLHARIGQLRQCPEKTCVPPWHHIAVFIPIVEHIPHEIYLGSIGRYALKKAHNTPLRLYRRGEIGCSEMQITKEIYGVARHGRSEIT